MKYVITMIDGEYQKPVAIDGFRLDHSPIANTNAMRTWIDDKPYVDGTGIHFLIDLPA